jgi:Kef-type K+ transport system membrane component KefB
MAHEVDPRRLSPGGKGKTNFPNYTACIEASCKYDVSHECQLTPDIFTFVGHTGVALMIFESGMHFDFEKAKQVGGWACFIAVFGTFLPLITGTALTILLIPDTKWNTDGLSAGTSLAPTSVGIALKLLHEAKQLQKTHGQIIITAAFVDDILSLVLFNVLFSMADGELGLMTFLPAVIGVILMCLVILFAATYADVVIEKGLEYFTHDPKAPGKMSVADEVLFFWMMMILLVFGTVFFYTGTHLWGCFMAGMCLAKLHSAHEVWVKQTKRVTVWMIRIFFSCTVAFSIPVSELVSIEAFWKGALMGIGPCILTKVSCAFFMGPQSCVIGWAMVGRAEFAYLIAQMAAASNMMTQKTFAVVIWSLLWATVWAPLVFRWVLKRFVAGERVRLGLGEDDDSEDGEGFRQSGPLPSPAEVYADFRPSARDTGDCPGYTYNAHGPQGAGYYKDGVDHAANAAAAKSKTASEHSAATPLKQDKVALEETVVSRGLDHEKPVKVGSAHDEHHHGHNTHMPSVVGAQDHSYQKHVVSPAEHNDYPTHDPEDASRGSGFLCCLFFRKIIIM